MWATLSVALLYPACMEAAQINDCSLRISGFASKPNGINLNSNWYNAGSTLSQSGTVKSDYQISSFLETDVLLGYDDDQKGYAMHTYNRSTKIVLAVCRSPKCAAA